MTEIDRIRPELKPEERSESFAETFQYFAGLKDTGAGSKDSRQLDLPGLSIDSKNSQAEQPNKLWSWRSQNELMDKVLNGGSLFVAENSTRSLASKPAEKPSSLSSTRPLDKDKTDEQVQKPTDAAELKKGPVKLDQEKFDTDSVERAFQIARENNLPVIVYKGANFCGNCPPVSRAIDKLASDIKNSSKTDAVVLKLNWERAEEIREQNPELAKLIDRLMPPNGSSFPDVKVYNPNDTSKPLKDGNGYGGDAGFLKSLVKVGQESLAAGKAEAPKGVGADNVAPAEKPTDAAELKKGPVKLDQEKFDTDSVEKAFKIARENNLPVIVYKGANFCGNCPPVSRAIDKLASDIKNSSKTDAVVLKLNWERAEEIREQNPELAKLIDRLMPPNGSSFPDVKVYNPNDTSKPLKAGNGYGGDAAFLKSLIKVGQESLALDKPETTKERTLENKAPEKAKLELQPRDLAEAKATPEFLPNLKLDTFDGKTVKLDDGTYKRDDQGRVVEMISADGKTKRSFKYEDSANPRRISSETVNDKTTYKFIGNCKIGGQPYKIDGKEVNSYSIYDENGKLKGNWSGVREVSPNGVYAFKDESMQSIEYRDAGGNKISEEARQTRERDGIWPQQIEFTRDDGSRLLAKLNGTRLESLTETSKENGKEKEVVWTKTGETWSTNETPARQRKNLSVDNSGTVRYDSADGSLKHEIFKDGTRAEVSKDGIRRNYNKENQLLEIHQANGDTRSLTYDGKDLSSITDKIGGKERKWSKSAGSDDWFNGQIKETRKDLQIKDNGSISFKDADAKNVSETADLARIISDDKNRPVEVVYPSGSNRKFSYNNDRLETVTDTVVFDGKEKSTTWTRNGDSNEFTSPGANGKTRSRTDIEAKVNGDFSYKTSDGKDHKSSVYDLERQARGEIVVGSESMQEARDRFLEAAGARGLKQERLDKYLNQLDATSKRFGTTPEQMSKALDNLSAILAAESGKVHSRDELDTVVETSLHNIAFPAEIDQGYHPTCNVTTTEVFVAARNPEKYTDLIKQVVLNGTYLTSFGSTVTPPEKALKPGRDEKGYDLDNPNIDKRNMASQVFQMTVINGVYELGKHSSQKDGKDNGTRYIMGDVRKKAIPNGFVDLGEDLLVDKNGRPKIGRDGDPVDGPEFIQDDVLTASELVVGKKMPYIEAPYKLENEANWHFDLPNSQRLLKAKADGQFPMGVPTIRGAHVQTIHDATVDSKGTTWVLLDNQHGVAKDGWVTLAELHKTQTQAIQLEPSRKPWQRPDQ